MTMSLFSKSNKGIVNFPSYRDDKTDTWINNTTYLEIAKNQEDFIVWGRTGDEFAFPIHKLIPNFLFKNYLDIKIKTAIGDYCLKRDFFKGEEIHDAVISRGFYLITIDNFEFQDKRKEVATRSKEAEIPKEVEFEERIRQAILHRLELNSILTPAFNSPNAPKIKIIPEHKFKDFEKDLMNDIATITKP